MTLYPHFGQEEKDSASAAARLFAALSALVLGLTLIWMQFPLGSNRAWAWSLLVLMIALAWLLWIPAALLDRQNVIRRSRKLLWPGLGFVAVLIWAWLQTVHWLPGALNSKIWSAIPVTGSQPSIAMNPYETSTEIMKLIAYLAAGFLAFHLGRSSRTANQLIIAMVASAVAYALYGFLLSAMGSSQYTILEGWSPPYGRDVTGGFVSKNSFAAYTGICLLAAILKLLRKVRHAMRAMSGSITPDLAIRALFDAGLWWLLASLVLFLALVAADSRAALAGTLFAALVALVLQYGASLRKARAVTIVVTLLFAGLIAGALTFAVGGKVVSRFAQLASQGGPHEMRPTVWEAGWRILEAHRWTGVGLGNFPEAYHLYAAQFVPFIVDRAHNDYLEFALGVGLPAAMVWIACLAWLVSLCVRATLTRHAASTVPAIAFAATMLLAFQSIVDFSLQMPAVAMLYAVIMGLGLGQALGGADRKPAQWMDRDGSQNE